MNSSFLLQLLEIEHIVIHLILKVIKYSFTILGKLFGVSFLMIKFLKYFIF